MTDRTFRKGLAVLLAAFAVLTVAVGAVVVFGFLGFGEGPPAMDDLHVRNAAGANHTVQVEVVAANGSTTFARTVRLAPGERRSFDGTTEYGSRYELLVTVDDGEPQSFDVEGPDDLCTTGVVVDSGATVDVVTSCA